MWAYVRWAKVRLEFLILYIDIDILYLLIAARRIDDDLYEKDDIQYNNYPQKTKDDIQTNIYPDETKDDMQTNIQTNIYPDESKDNMQTNIYPEESRPSSLELHDFFASTEIVSKPFEVICLLC